MEMAVEVNSDAGFEPLEIGTDGAACASSGGRFRLRRHQIEREGSCQIGFDTPCLDLALARDTIRWAAIFRTSGETGADKRY